MSSVKRVCVLGSTGSIGVQALDIISKNPDRLQLVGLACGRRSEKLLEQARRFGVSNVAIGDMRAAASGSGKAVSEYISSCENGKGGYFGAGDEALLDLIDECDPDVVVNSLVGAHGLRMSYETLKRGTVLALANKESLVVGGDIIMPLAYELDAAYPRLGDDAEFRPQGYLMPIDSEHGAIFQCLLGERSDEVSKLIVTASGGPFRNRSLSDLRSVTAKDALAHPTWNMGPKITIDSSTLMNKGLEVIEAHHLFGADYDDIEVVVQPQSAIHSMVEFKDGSVKAHLGTTDMRIPIQFALSYPERWDAPVERVDFRKLGQLEFDAPDLSTFKCLSFAFEAGRAGGTLPCAMNAANEVAVERFLAGIIKWTDIADTVEHVMQLCNVQKVESIEQLVEVDEEARRLAFQYIGSL